MQHSDGAEIIQSLREIRFDPMLNFKMNQELLLRAIEKPNLYEQIQELLTRLGMRRDLLHLFIEKLGLPRPVNRLVDLWEEEAQKGP